MTIPTARKAAFTGAHVAGQLFRDTPSMLLLFYLTSIVGMSPALAGTAVFIPKAILGSISDLIVGVGSDRIAGRFPRRNWLLLGAISAPFVFTAIFAVPTAAPWIQAMYVIAAMTAYMIAFSAVSVPYLAQYSEVSNSAAERSDLMAWRHGWIGIGLLAGSSFAPWLIHLLGAGRRAYLITGLVLSAIAGVALLSGYLASRRLPIRRAASTAANALSWRVLGEVFGDRRFNLLLAVFLAHQVAAGMSSATIVFFLTYNMKLEAAIAQLGVLIMLAGLAVIAASPLWIYLSRRFGTRACYQGAVIAQCVLMSAWASLGPDSPVWHAYLISTGIGLANSGWGIMLLAFFSDVLADRNQDGKELGGAMSAVWTLAEKFGLAFGGALMAGSILSLFGFSASRPVEGTMLTGIALTFGFLPAVIHFVAGLVFWRWVVLPADLPASAPRHA
jgi:glycoside/pentoside/hexuronide:cation symporter, GPH family